MLCNTAKHTDLLGHTLMRIKTFSPTAAVYPHLYRLAQAVQHSDKPTMLACLNDVRSLAVFTNKPAWRACFAKIDALITTGQSQATIFSMSGNSKLPFISFSSLPGVTCPGAGDCLAFCYSFSAWRYPAAFMRQLNNAFLLRFESNQISVAFDAIDNKMQQAYDVRLYVDGDFSSTDDVSFWFDLIKTSSKANVYGYSKSFAQILSYSGTWPTNYVLNISSGHNSDTATVDAVKALPITRGEFIAVSLGRKVRSKEHGTVTINKELRAAYGAKAFPCPGACGSCTGKGHACGMQTLKGLPIIIAVH